MNIRRAPGLTILISLPFSRQETWNIPSWQYSWCECTHKYGNKEEEHQPIILAIRRETIHHNKYGVEESGSVEMTFFVLNYCFCYDFFLYSSLLLVELGASKRSRECSYCINGLMDTSQQIAKRKKVYTFRLSLSIPLTRSIVARSTTRDDIETNPK